MKTLLVLVLGCASIAAQTSSYTITTVAGGLATIGDGGTALAARFFNALGIATDPAGNLYIADGYSNRVRRVDRAGIITTVAGTGTQGYRGDAGPATSAQLDNPSGVAVDAMGNLYIADLGNSRIRRVDRTGTITTIAGNGNVATTGDGGSALAASLGEPAGYGPWAIAADNIGNVYLADVNRLRKVTSSGIITTIAGTGVWGNTGDGGPATSAQVRDIYGIIVDPGGNVVFTSGDRIRKVSPAGIITTIAGGGNKGFTEGANATAVALLPAILALGADNQGNLYFPDKSARVFRLSAAGQLYRITGQGWNFTSAGDNGPASAASISYVSAVSVDAPGNMYFTDTTTHIRRISTDGTITTFAGATSFGENEPARAAFLPDLSGVALRSDGRFFLTAGGPADSRPISSIDTAGILREGPPLPSGGSGPDRLAASPNGTLYVSAMPDVYAIAPDGTVTRIAGNGTYGNSGDGGPATSASLTYPAGLTVDANGTLFVADWDAHCVRKITADGVITTVAGTGASGYSGDNGPATQATLNAPGDVAVDNRGNLYIADSDNNVIRRVTNGTISTIAGTGHAGYNGDNIPATTALLNTPKGIAVDSNGSVLLTEYNGHRIRRIDQHGTITTIAGTGVTDDTGDSGPATSATIAFPKSITIASDGTIYVADSGNNAVRKLTPVACTPPTIATQPQSQSVASGQAITLTVAAPAAASYQWYQGQAGDTSHPVGTNSATLQVTPPSTTSYWVRVSNPCGTADSSVAKITVQQQAVPTFTTAGVVNAASGRPGLVAGSMAAIYGTNLANTTAVASGGTWPTILAGSRVLVGGIAAPLYYVGPGQIDLQVPWEIAGAKNATILVDNGGTMSAGAVALVLDLQPGLFLTNGRPDVYHASTSQIVSTSHPLTPGETLILMGTGFGSVYSPPPTGHAASLTTLSPTSTAPQASIGYQNAPVPFAGLAPGEIGVYQLNVVVPTSIASAADQIPSGCVPITVTIQNTVWASVLPTSSTDCLTGIDSAFPNDGQAWHVNSPGGQSGPACDTYLGATLQATQNIAGIFSSSNVSTRLSQLMVPGYPSGYLAYFDASDQKCLSGAGGEIQTPGLVHFGYYEAAMLPPAGTGDATSGTVTGFFVYLRSDHIAPMLGLGAPSSTDGNEIDIEILSRENDLAKGTGIANLTVHLPGNYSVTTKVPLTFAPWASAHRYGFDWQPDGITWYIDGTPVPITTCTSTLVRPDGTSVPIANPGCFIGATNVPQLPGFLLLNHWSNGGAWSGRQPTTQQELTLQHVTILPGGP